MSEMQAPPPPRRGFPRLAWCIILALVLFEVILPYIRRTRSRESMVERESRAISDLQLRYIVGVADLLNQRESTYPELGKQFNTGPVGHRLRFIVAAGELKGPEEAIAQIAKLRKLMGDEGVEPTPEQATTLARLDRLYADYQAGRWQAPSLTEEDREDLRQQLGWAGRLALTPAEGSTPEERQEVLGPARRLAMALLAVAVGALGFGCLGLFALLVLVAFLLAGRLRPAMPLPQGHGGLYAEGFAVYMLVFLGLSIGRYFLPWQGPELAVSGAAMLLALAAGLFWPVLRGLPFDQVRRDVGLTLGGRPWLEPGIGLVGYLLVLPCFGLGLVVTLILMTIQRRLTLGNEPERHFAPLEQPSHPIVDWVGEGNIGVILQIVVIASILAPLVEETMFRGLLYRQLREATWGWGRTLSFVASALVVSFIFAVIHPQGLLAVPVLMGLAFGLNLLREWRGTLLPSMIVHGLHNGLATFLLVQGIGRG